MTIIQAASSTEAEVRRRKSARKAGSAEKAAANRSGSVTARRMK
jgi:hypothetical protein